MNSNPTTRNIDNEIGDIVIVETHRWTPAHDTIRLIHLVREVSGDILEIGCNLGITTKELAEAFPDRTVCGVDFVLAKESMTEKQKWEAPTEVGSIAKHLSNVRIFEESSFTFDYRKAGSPKIIFIDGDHSYEGVRRDTEKAMDYLRATGGGRIIWHDYHDRESDWCSVKRYLNDCVPEHTFIENSWLALLDIKG